MRLDCEGRYRSLRTAFAAGDPNRRPLPRPREVRRGAATAIAMLALLAACAPEQAPRVVRVTYHCDEDRSFAVRYERDGQAVLELADGEWVLPEVSASAGARYDDGARRLELHGRDATLRGTATTYSNCIARDWQESPLR
jgi:membrane-bound inhibitor of C-type lysozyme